MNTLSKGGSTMGKKPRNNLLPEIRERIHQRDKICQICKESKKLTIHHKRPRSQGGTNNDSNLILLCKNCHDAIHGRREENGQER